jgi:peptidoglycan/xylan/chitin deacetylase (PgdA/CDA1 family)
MLPHMAVGALRKSVTVAARAALAFCAASILALPAQAESGRIALTFDDLPVLSVLDDQPYVDYTTQALLRGLVRHHLPATGFVNETNVDDADRTHQIANLDQWLRSGMDLGNHTYSHEAASDSGAAEFIADIERGERVTSWLLARHGKRMRWFRHPYLDTGSPAPVRAEIDAWLSAHHYRVAPVTIDAKDWEWSEPYDLAIARQDDALRLRLKQGYLDYTEKAIVWYRSAAKILFGRDIAYVMLLHATRLNADCIDDLSAILRRQHLRAVTLDSALQDRAYRTPDTWISRNGAGWLARWAQSQNKTLPWSTFEPVPDWLHAEYDRVDDDRGKAAAYRK